MKTITSLLILGTLCLSQAFSAEEKPVAAAQRTFATPLAAADAFIEALKTGDTPPLLEIFGVEHKDAIGTADLERDRDCAGVSQRWPRSAGASGSMTMNRSQWLSGSRRGHFRFRWSKPKTAGASTPPTALGR